MPTVFVGFEQKIGDKWPGERYNLSLPFSKSSLGADVVPIMVESKPETMTQKIKSTHIPGAHSRILLTSVFGPYAQDDEFGSRAINPMELYHNQVTRLEGPFSLRMFHRSWGLMMIQP